MDIRKIKKLIDLLAKTDVVEIEIKEGEHLVRLSRKAVGNGEHVMMPYVATAAAPPLMPTSQLTTKGLDSYGTAQSTGVDNKHYMRSPMVGTMYAAACPEAPPFVSIGKRVNVGDVLCIIEAMKMFNEIEADKAGIIVEILVNNGEPVEYDQPLFVVEE